MSKYSFSDLARAYNGSIPVGAFASFINSCGESIDVQKPFNVGDGDTGDDTGEMKNV